MCKIIKENYNLCILCIIIIICITIPIILLTMANCPDNILDMSIPDCQRELAGLIIICLDVIIIIVFCCYITCNH